MSRRHRGKDEIRPYTFQLAKPAEGRPCPRVPVYGSIYENTFLRPATRACRRSVAEVLPPLLAIGPELNRTADDDAPPKLRQALFGMSGRRESGGRRQGGLAGDDVNTDPRPCPPACLVARERCAPRRQCGLTWIVMPSPRGMPFSRRKPPDGRPQQAARVRFSSRTKLSPSRFPGAEPAKVGDPLRPR